MSRTPAATSPEALGLDPDLLEHLLDESYPLHIGLHLIRSGRVLVDGIPTTDPDARVWPGAEVTVSPS